MNSNTLRFFSLALLVNVTASVVATPATVTELGGGSSSSAERLERMLEIRNQMQMNMQRQLAQIADELDEMRGTVEENSHTLNQILERQRNLYKEIDILHNAKRESVVENKLKKPSTSEVYSSNQFENEEYDAAVNLILKEKNYTGATQAFNIFLIEYPQSIYKPNAHYWLGQLYFSKSELDLAKQHFDAVSHHAKSSKRADALLKLGMIADRQGDKVNAQILFQNVIKEYPRTTTASQAEKQMKK
ncbi:tol-pal system protein YbgF [Candidatus Enterovibrio altilux]|uniref:Cell division coordinator CpoB n=1 Tax=Candidatus Enterovibrio altilux TaxID=1927128 RepID=A0A291BBQ4_9GAMM|nr:tol-pal system protein YbgF [Candidatus Enterovibrio luxaltus]ATF10427.1 TPR repeat containing exported protein [Candidatus Enterovibrio luxaltus]